MLYKALVANEFQADLHKFQIFGTDCSEPPEGPYVAWKEKFSYVKGEFWTGTVVKYACEPEHSFQWKEPELLTCGHGGSWDHDASPRCAPSESCFDNFVVFLRFAYIHFSICC